MQEELDQIRDQQKQSWNKFSAGWKKWDSTVMDFMKPMADEIIGSLDLQRGHAVLDIAAGTGEPGLTIAALVAPGKVIITDLAEDMLQVAREKVGRSGLTNVEILAADVSALPFADDTFDAISCRFGFMFFPDMLLAAQEMVRVLKPGGKIAVSVWDTPDKNYWVTAVMGVINKNMQLPPPPPGAPGMFRCAKPGFIAGLFEQAGLKNVTEKQVAGKLKSRTTEAYWDMTLDVGAPIVAALSKANDATKAKIKEEVFKDVNSRYAEGDVILDSGALVISGQK